MSICILVMTDGRDYVHDTLASIDDSLIGDVTHRVIHDDSGDGDHRARLAESWPGWEVIGGRRSGFGGAIRRAWAHVRTLRVDHVWHHEDDFTLNRPVDLDDIAEVLDDQRHLVQMALRRQPWNPEERAAGGVVELNPSDYCDVRDDLGREWLEHRRFFTTNPSMYRRQLCDREWPTGANSEGRFSAALFADTDVWSALWGPRDSGEWVTHIGNERVGRGY